MTTETATRRGPGKPPLLEPDEGTLRNVRKLRELACTVEEAAAFFEVHKKTFYEFMARHPEVRDAWERGDCEGRMSLRRYQHEMAKTNANMAIWLGKQRLGQTDRREISGPHGGAIPLDIDATRLAKLTEEQLGQLENLLTIMNEPILLEAVAAE
jgi:hypothetical protein